MLDATEPLNGNLLLLFPDQKDFPLVPACCPRIPFPVRHSNRRTIHQTVVMFHNGSYQVFPTVGLQIGFWPQGQPSRRYPMVILCDHFLTYIPIDYDKMIFGKRNKSWFLKPKKKTSAPLLERPVQRMINEPGLCMDTNLIHRNWKK